MAKLTLEQKNKRKLSGIKNKLIKCAQYKYEVDLEIQRLSLEGFKNGATRIVFETVSFGEKVMSEYDASDMLDAINTYPYIVNFINNHDYNSLLNGYFLDVMTNIAAVKCNNKTSSSLFDTDICLNILFAMTYCSDELIEQLILKLPFFKENQVEKNKTPIFFSAHNLLPMVYYFYSHRYPEKTFPLDVHDSVDSKDKPINPDIYENISPVYRNIIDNLYTDDDKAFGDMVITMCDYHLENSKDNFLLEFNHIEWQYFPIEILFLLKERHKKGKSIEGITHPLIDDFLPYFLNEFEVSEQNQQILKLILE